ncbi:hypothetical protein QCA50_004056 [Cerrena zonata]|uniref:Serine protease inhibitor n=1 Tax=Cerrena zonata TaxID=2478898 RepID=A0AAW0GSA6_9APHY
MSLKSGIYQIQSSDKSQSFIGRNRAEDRSLNPKRVVALAPGILPLAPWVVEQLDNGRYILKAGGRPTADIDHKLWAVLLDEPPATEWIITPVSRVANNAYTIENSNGSGGWVVTEDEEDNQIAVRPLIVGPSEPPFYPPSEVFIFEEAPED